VFASIKLFAFQKRRNEKSLCSPRHTITSEFFLTPPFSGFTRLSKSTQFPKFPVNLTLGQKTWVFAVGQ
jgi:hypothetical protein